MKITYNKPVTKKLKSLGDLEKILKDIYKNKRNTIIEFDYNPGILEEDYNGSYISIDFDEYCDEGKASTYIDIHNVYLRMERTIEDLLYIVEEFLMEENTDLFYKD